MVVDRVAFALVRCENPSLVLRCRPRSARKSWSPINQHESKIVNGVWDQNALFRFESSFMWYSYITRKPHTTTSMSKSCFWTQDEGCPNAGHDKVDDDDYDCKLSEWTSQSLMFWDSDCFPNDSDMFWLDWWWSMRVRDTWYLLPWLYTKYQRVDMCLSNATVIGWWTTMFCT